MIHFLVLFVITAPYLWSYGSDLGPSCDMTVCAVQLCNGTGNPNFGDCLCSASTPDIDIIDCLQRNCQRNSDYWSQISDLDGCCGMFSLRRLTDFKDAYAHSMDIVRNYTADASIPISAISQCSGFANGLPTGVDSKYYYDCFQYPSCDWSPPNSNRRFNEQREQRPGTSKIVPSCKFLCFVWDVVAGIHVTPLFIHSFKFFRVCSSTVYWIRCSSSR
jgi:hypothetical protein